MTEDRKILVVEDEREVREFLYDAFAEEGYDVVAVSDAEEALAALDPKIMVMFLDMKLPGDMDGLELCRKIREDYPTACIYAMTGHSTLFELADCRAAGFDDYFTKPLRLETLYMAAEQAFDRIDRWKKK
jgi:DNA-binding response OmpR family regulator